MREEKKTKVADDQVKEMSVCDQMIKNITGHNSALKKIVKAVNQSKI